MVKVECICPPTPAGETRHPDGDTIELRERLGFHGALASRNTIQLGKEDGDDVAEIMASLTEMFIVQGIASWSVVDAKGKAVEPSRPTIVQYLLPHVDAAMVVGDQARELYEDAVLLPLALRAQNSSPHTSTNGSMSATNGAVPKPRKPSKRSSTTTTPTAAIETISASPDGDSNSSQS